MRLSYSYFVLFHSMFFEQYIKIATMINNPILPTNNACSFSCKTLQIKAYKTTNIIDIFKLKLIDFKKELTKKVINKIVAPEEIKQAMSNPKYSDKESKSTKFTLIAKPTKAY